MTIGYKVGLFDAGVPQTASQHCKVTQLKVLQYEFRTFWTKCSAEELNILQTRLCGSIGGFHIDMENVDMQRKNKLCEHETNTVC